MCLASGIGFGAMAVFGKLSYDEGATVGTLLVVRFGLAAVLFWLLLAARGAVGEVRTLSRRDLGLALALGAAGDRAGRGGEVGLRQRRPLEQRFGVLHQDESRVREPDAAARAFEQRHARLALEDRELLGDRRRRELERVGDRGDRAALVQLAEEAEAAQVEHRLGTLPIQLHEYELLLMLR